MARQVITPAEVSGPWPSTTANAGGVALSETAANATDKEEIVGMTGREILIARNTGLSARVVTVTSVADPETGRTGDITESVPAGETYVLGPFSVKGFRQTNGKLYFEAAHADISWSAIRT